MKEKILIVEDNPKNMRLIEMTLQARGYTLLGATDGEEALEMATRLVPDLIIMDIQLPKMNGLEVTARLKRMPAMASVPVIAITAYAMKGDEEKAFQAGCDAYLPKPIDTRQLPEVVAALLQGRPEPMP
ncbi:MAG: response regulator [Chloroflexota bacterium]